MCLPQASGSAARRADRKLAGRADGSDDSGSATEVGACSRGSPPAGPSFAEPRSQNRGAMEASLDTTPIAGHPASASA